MNYKITGCGLLSLVADCPDRTKGDICRMAGYVNKNGTPAFYDFYQEIINTKNRLETQRLIAAGIIDPDGEDDEYTADQRILLDHMMQYHSIHEDDAYSMLQELHDMGITDPDSFDESYVGCQEGWNATADFARQEMEECGYINSDNVLCDYIDWEQVWNGLLRYDYTEITANGDSYFFRNV